MTSDDALQQRDATFVHEHREELADVARDQYRRHGRGAVLAVHADGFLQVALYRSLDEATDSEVRDAEARIGGVIDALRSYDPTREFVVLLADSVTSGYTCWRVKPSPASDSEQLVYISGHGSNRDLSH